MAEDRPENSPIPRRDAMEPQDWKRLRSVLEEVLDRPREDQVEALDSKLADRPDLLREARQMLHREQQEDPRFEPLQRQAPARLGPWRVGELLGTGGMGQVFRGARADGAFEREVAIKLLKPEWANANLRARFQRERTVQAGLEHPGVASVLDAGETDDGQPFLVMELVEGLPINRACDVRGLDTRERVQLFVLACDAVQHAHQRGVIHRDLKPTNVYVTSNGHPKLLDFGVAKLLEDIHGTDDEELTAEARAFYTPAYASPEQVRGEAVAPSSDVYSLGVLLYHLLTGTLPVEVGTTSRFELERAVCAVDPLPPSRRTSGPERLALRGDLDAVLLKALRKEPGERYADAGELATDLRRHLDAEPVLARRGQNFYALRRSVRRHRVGLALGALSLVAIVALAIALRPHPSADPDSTAQALSAYAQGLAARDRGDYETAVGHFDAALALDPGFAACQLRRAWSLLWREHQRDQGQTERALRAALAEPGKLAAVDREKAWILNELARADFFPTDPEALERARQLAEDYPQDPEAVELWVEMAFHHQAATDAREALTAAERLIDLRPRSTSGHLHRFLAAARCEDPSALAGGAQAYLASAVDGMYRGDAALHLGMSATEAVEVSQHPATAGSPQRVAALARVALVAGDANLCRSVLASHDRSESDLDVYLRTQLLMLEGRIADAVALCSAPSEDWRIYELRLALGIPMGLETSGFPRWILALGLEAVRSGNSDSGEEWLRKLQTAHALRPLPITRRGIAWLQAELATAAQDWTVAKEHWLLAADTNRPVENIEVEAILSRLYCAAAGGLLRAGEHESAERILNALEARRPTLHMGQLQSADWIAALRAGFLRARLAEHTSDLDAARRAYDAFLTRWGTPHPTFPEIEAALLRRAALDDH